MTYFWIQFAFPIQITFIWSPSWLLALQCGLYSRFIKFHFHLLFTFFLSSFLLLYNIIEVYRKWICESVLIVFCSGKKSVMLYPPPAHPPALLKKRGRGAGSAVAVIRTQNWLQISRAGDVNHQQINNIEAFPCYHLAPFNLYLLLKAVLSLLL